MRSHMIAIRVEKESMGRLSVLSDRIVEFSMFGGNVVVKKCVKMRHSEK